MSVSFLPSGTGTMSTASTPIPYTGNPFLLCWFDIVLFYKCSWSLLGILHPWNSWNCKDLDELYPFSPWNLLCLVLHGFLILLQLVFLVSLPFLVIFPVWVVGLYMGGVMLVVAGVCWVLNGGDKFLESKVDLGGDKERFEEELWVYMNGVSVGKHWLQGNLDRLALTFRRPLIGFHNRTYGIIFDLLQCMIERNFCYATTDVRNAYGLIKERIIKPEYKKVVLILHSQGGIEGGLMVDWLLSELPHDIIQKLEIYTFGCAANHFNNPHRSAAHMAAEQNGTIPTQNGTAPTQNDTILTRGDHTHAVKHIEHYANDGDFVARWGVLSYTSMENRYMGRVFIRSGMGHLLNQHYLNSMFALDENMRVKENDDDSFMNSQVSFTSDGAVDKARDALWDTLRHGGTGANGAIVEDGHSPVEPVSLERADSVLAAKLAKKKPKVRDFSRLWEYRNGGSPED